MSVPKNENNAEITPLEKVREEMGLDTLPASTGKRGRKSADAKPPKREKRSYATELAEMTKERDKMQGRIDTALRLLSRAQEADAAVGEKLVSVAIDCLHGQLS